MEASMQKEEQTMSNIQQGVRKSHQHRGGSTVVSATLYRDGNSHGNIQQNTVQHQKREFKQHKCDIYVYMILVFVYSVTTADLCCKTWHSFILEIQTSFPTVRLTLPNAGSSFQYSTTCAASESGMDLFLLYNSGYVLMQLMLLGVPFLGNSSPLKRGHRDVKRSWWWWRSWWMLCYMATELQCGSYIIVLIW